MSLVNIIYKYSEFFFLILFTRIIDIKFIDIKLYFIFCYNRTKNNNYKIINSVHGTTARLTCVLQNDDFVKKIIIETFRVETKT